MLSYFINKKSNTIYYNDYDIVAGYVNVQVLLTG